MTKIKLPKSNFQFLKKLAKNNNRDWFQEHKEGYQTEHAEFKKWAETLFNRMQEYDNLERVKVYRIYRDVRFSKDKTPYKNNFALSLKRATKWLRGGMYLHLEPGHSFIGGGFWGPNSADLKRIRQELAVDAASFRQILAEKKLIETFGELQGNQLKTAPRDFPKDHADIDLLRFKQFLLMKNFSDEEVFADDFMEKVMEALRNMRPFFDYMSDVLTTDVNGVRIED